MFGNNSPYFTPEDFLLLGINRQQAVSNDLQLQQLNLLREHQGLPPLTPDLQPSFNFKVWLIIGCWVFFVLFFSSLYLVTDQVVFGASWLFFWSWVAFRSIAKVGRQSRLWEAWVEKNGLVVQGRGQ